jgi:hypothetical protein
MVSQARRPRSSRAAGSMRPRSSSAWLRTIASLRGDAGGESSYNERSWVVTTGEGAQMLMWGFIAVGLAAFLTFAWVTK